MSCLILFKSITYAQNAISYLTSNGINAYLMRKPGKIPGNGCGYGLRVNCNNIDTIRIMLDNKGFGYLSIWKNNGSEWVSL